MKNIFTKIIAFTGILGLGLSLASCGGSSDEDANITLYTRDTTSGTRDGFFTGIGFSLAKEDDSVLPSGIVVVDSNGSMISAIKNDVNGIGYISLSSLETSGVKGLTYEGVEPTEANVINATYKLTRNFNYCLRAEYSSDSVKQICEAFVAYLNTTDGQATIKDKGGIIDNAATQSWTSVKSNYEIASQDNSSITINVGGSTSVKSIVSQLLSEFSAKCGNFKYNYAPTGSGDAYKRTNGTEKDGTNALDLAFASREFKTEEAMDSTIKGKMCVDAIVAVVNNDNSVSSVTAAQLKSIYDGTYTTWSQVK